MRRLTILCILVLACAGVRVFASDDIPTALIFPVTAGTGAMPDQASKATQSLRTYFLNSEKLNTVLYDPQSAIVKRAMAENGLKAEDLVGIDSPQGRVKIGKLVGVDYVIAGSISYDTSIKLDLWMANIKTEQVWGFQGDGVVVDTGRRELAISNAIEMAANKAVTGATEIVLKDVKVAVVPPTIGDKDPNAPQHAAVPEMTSSADDAKAHVQRAVDALKSRDQATAIQEYRRAIDSDPKNVDIRLRLAQVYTVRQMYAEALDELSRAQAMDPKNESIAQETERVRRIRSGLEPAPGAQNQASPSPTTATPNRVVIRPNAANQSDVGAGDAFWQKKDFLEAEKRYRLAVGLDDGNTIAHERLALLMTALGRFDAAKIEALRLQQLQPNLEAQGVSDRFARFEAYVVRHIKYMVQEYDTQAQNFEAKSLTREDYYAKSQSLSTRVEALIRLNDVLAPPEAQASVYQHQTLGLSLFSQALTHLVSYLESNKKNESDSAAIMMTEARKHLTGTGK